MSQTQTQTPQQQDQDATTSTDTTILGISVYWLSTGLCQEIKNFGLDLDVPIHQIEPLNHDDTNISVIRYKGKDRISPIDHRKGVAYVDCLSHADHVGKATHMLSYTWSYKFSDIISTLLEFCRTNQLDTKRVYIWIDVLCINQYRVVEAKQDGGTGLLNFETTFPPLLKRIGHMLIMMSPWDKPYYLSRIWCIYELYTAHQQLMTSSQSSPSSDIDGGPTTATRIRTKSLTTTTTTTTVIIPPQERQRLENHIFDRNVGYNPLFDVCNNVQIQKAQCTYECDRKRILSLIQETVGYETLNNTVKHLIHSYARNVVEDIIYERLLLNDTTKNNNNNKNDNTTTAPPSSSPSLSEEEEEEEENNDNNNDDGAAIDLMIKIGHYLLDNWELDESENWFSKALSIGSTKRTKTTTRKKEEEEEVDDAVATTSNAVTNTPTTEQQQHQRQQCITVANCYDGIGQVLRRKCRYDSALEKLRHGLAIRQHLLGENHMDTAKSYNNVGLILGKLKHYDEALEMHRKSLSIYEALRRRHGSGQQQQEEEHVYVAQSHNNIGLVYNDMGDYDQAMEHQERNLEICSKLYGKDHFNTGFSYKNIAAIKMNQGRLDESLSYHRMALSNFQSGLISNHPLAAMEHWSIGTVLEQMGNIDEALVEHKNAYQVRQTVLGRDHPETIESQLAIQRLSSK